MWSPWRDAREKKGKGYRTMDRKSLKRLELQRDSEAVVADGTPLSMCTPGDGTNKVPEECVAG